MSLVIAIQPNYHDYDDESLHLSYQEFQQLNEPDVHDFAYRGSEHQFDKDWRLYNKLLDFFDGQIEAMPSIKLGYHCFDLIRQIVVKNIPNQQTLIDREEATIDYLLDHSSFDGTYPAQEVRKLAALMDRYPLLTINKTALAKVDALNDYHKFVDLVHQAAIHGKSLEFF